MVESNQQLNTLDGPVTKVHEGTDTQHERGTEGKDDHRKRASDAVSQDGRPNPSRNRDDRGPPMQDTSKLWAGSTKETPSRRAEVLGAGIVEQRCRYLHGRQG